MWNLSRRAWLSKAGYGMGGLALTQVLPGGGIFSVPAEAAEAPTFAADDPLAPKAPHFPPKVKSVIWLHIDGAPSSLDLYDYKPELVKLKGQEIPASFLKGLKTSTQGGVGKLFEANRQWNWTMDCSAFACGARRKRRGARCRMRPGKLLAITGGNKSCRQKRKKFRS